MVCKCGGHPVYIPSVDVYVRTPTRTPHILRMVFVIVMPREDIAFPVRFSKVTHGHPTAQSSAALLKLTHAQTRTNSNCAGVLMHARSPARIHLRIHVNISLKPINAGGPYIKPLVLENRIETRTFGRGRLIRLRVRRAFTIRMELKMATTSVRHRSVCLTMRFKCAFNWNKSLLGIKDFT